MKVMQELVAHYGVYPANSLNPARIEGHQATVFLTAQFFGWQCRTGSLFLSVTAATAHPWAKP
jgi:threonine synthase